jgi:UDP-galactopyranose mutase
MKNILIIGAGLSGSTIARILADNQYNITVIDKRNHIAGNCFDYTDNGLRIHAYGPHIFHTNSEKVVKFLSDYTEFVEYKHRVKALYQNNFLTLPPNLETIKILGDDLVDVIYRPYTKKMWDCEIDDSVIARIKPRSDHNQYYFPDDKYQYLPKDGYTKMVENILNHPNIKIILNTGFDISLENDYDHIFNSMPIDEYYDYCFGPLAYRSIKFHNITNIDHDMPTAVVNYTDDGKYTRVTSWEKFPNHGSGNVYTLEEPCDYKDNNHERYYPIKDKDGKNKEIYKQYSNIHNPKTTFIGRLGKYQYYDMHIAVASSLTIAEKFIQDNRC